jgi:N-acetylglucosaminyldiphosphoundecaprenol N-acetyl-beta-D-mannosaminyltransferase
MIEKIGQLTLDETVDWIFGHQSGVVLCCTLNEIVMAKENIEVRNAMNRADLLTPDGMPLVWYLRWKYGKGERVYGPDIMRKILNPKSQILKKMLFLGDEKNREYFEKYGEYLGLPYKERFEEKDYKSIAKIVNKSGAKIVWIGLGSAKQILMADGLKRNAVEKVMITVGAAFDFLSDNKKQAPRWIQKSGLEWLYRMTVEPKRLWKRYIKVLFFLGRKIVKK